MKLDLQVITTEIKEKELYEGVIIMRLLDEGVERVFTFRNEMLTDEYIKITLMYGTRVLVEISGDTPAALDMLEKYDQLTRSLFVFLGELIQKGIEGVYTYRKYHLKQSPMYEHMRRVLMHNGIPVSYQSRLSTQSIVDDDDMIAYLRAL